MKQHLKMCSECPFRKNAAAGWLGGGSAALWHHRIHSGGDQACHMAVATMTKKGLPENVIDATVPLCVGMTRYRQSVMKEQPTERSQRVLEMVERLPDQPLIERFRFYEHHSRPMTGKPLPKRKKGQQPVYPPLETQLKFWAGELE